MLALVCSIKSSIVWRYSTVREYAKYTTRISIISPCVCHVAINSLKKILICQGRSNLQMRAAMAGTLVFLPIFVP